MSDTVSAGSFVALRTRMNKLMQRAMGIERDEARLKEAISELEKMEADSIKIHDDNAEPYEGTALINSIRLARALVMSALERRESRGAHQRSDFPEESDEFLKKTVARRARVSDEVVHCGGIISVENYSPVEIKTGFENI